GAPTRIPADGWWGAVHEVAEVEGEVTRLGLEPDDGQVALLTPLQPVVGVPVRARQGHELTVLGIGVVELDSGLDERAQNRVATDAVIGVPAEIAVTLDDVGG